MLQTWHHWYCPACSSACVKPLPCVPPCPRCILRELLRLLRGAIPGVSDAALRFAGVQLYLVLMEGDGSLGFVDLVKVGGCRSALFQGASGV